MIGEEILAGVVMGLAICGLFIGGMILWSIWDWINKKSVVEER